jgi:hypothetical protein
MSVKICGHKVRCQKPIKIYTLTKHVIVLLMLVMVCGPAWASDLTADERCALVSPASGIDPAPKPRPMAEPREISPAHMMALAFGVRNIVGPMEKSQMHYSPRDKNKIPSASSRHAASRTSDDPSSHDGCQASLVQDSRLPRLAMQR